MSEHRPLPISYGFVRERLRSLKRILEPVGLMSLQEIFAIFQANPIEWIAIYPMVESATAEQDPLGKPVALVTE